MGADVLNVGHWDQRQVRCLEPPLLRRAVVVIYDSGIVALRGGYQRYATTVELADAARDAIRRSPVRASYSTQASE